MLQRVQRQLLLAFVVVIMLLGSQIPAQTRRDRKSTRLNSSHSQISYAVFCLKKKKNLINVRMITYTQIQGTSRNHRARGKLYPSTLQQAMITAYHNMQHDSMHELE